MPDRESDATRALASETFGKGDRVALIHGFTQTGRSWRPVVEQLANRFQVMTVDLPGHGRSGTVDATDLEEAGRMVAEAVGDAAYVGYSLGGRIALHAAFVAPTRVRSLLLVGASAGIADADERAARRADDDALADRLDGAGSSAMSMDTFLDEWLAQPIFAGLSTEAQGRAARRENATSALARALRHLGVGTQVLDREKLANLEMPVLLVAGERDAKYRAITTEVAEVIGENATVDVVAACGHAAPFEQPIAFAELIATFMESLRDR